MLGAATRCERALDGRGKIGGRRDELAMAAQRLGHLLVARGQELAAVRALRSIVSELNLALGIPRGVVADHGDEGQRVAHAGVDFRHVKTKGAVSQDRDDRRGGVGGARRKRKRDRRADGARRAVHDAPCGRQHRLRPLADFAAVANEEGVPPARDHALQFTAQLGGMQFARATRRAHPCRRAKGQRRAHVIEPAACGMRAARAGGKRRKRRPGIGDGA
jgi:hypothetical protein